MQTEIAIQSIYRPAHSSPAIDIDRRFVVISPSQYDWQRQLNLDRSANGEFARRGKSSERESHQILTSHARDRLPCCYLNQL